MPPWKPGQSGNPKGRPKGKRNFKTDFEIAVREIAKRVKKGEEVEWGYIELVKRGLRSAFKGNYNFWREFVERLYGKEPEKIEYSGSIEEKVDEETKKLIEEFHQWLKEKIKKKK